MTFDPRLQRLDEFRWRIPRDAHRGMLTDVIVFASAPLLEQIGSDSSLDQAINVAMLPRIVGSSLAMPDIHQGYGFPIGGVAATSWEDGVVSPGGVGFDINCGVRLLRVALGVQDVRPCIREVVHQLFRDVPCGTGGTGSIMLSPRDLDAVLMEGAPWMINRGYGEARDAEYSEAGACLPGADLSAVSNRAKERGRLQVGTLGSGNHFLEVQFVERVEDDDLAQTLGLVPGQIVVLIHSGSRGLGHQVCVDHLRDLGSAMVRYGLTMPDRQLACAPIHSPEGQAYLAAMRAAANFAWANRQGITHFVRQAFRKVFGREVPIDVIYDV